jgi:hypothetical protein
MDIQLLPTELLTRIFFHLDNADDSRKDINHCRLVSRCFNNASSSLLITRVKVHLTLESFARLEDICNHTVFSKSLQVVQVDLSYYEDELASDRQLFMQEARSRLLRHVEAFERSRYHRTRYSMTDDLFGWLSKMAWGQGHEFDQLLSGETEKAASTPIEKLYSKVYNLYQQKYQNQQSLRQNGKHIDRLCTALCSLSKLVSLELEDSKSWGSDLLDTADFLDTGFDRSVLKHFDSALRKSNWCGSFQTKNTATPPVEMLGTLCARLGDKGLRPKILHLALTPPPDMRVWQLSSAQQAGVKHLVSQSTDLIMHVNFFARGHSRSASPKDEMLSLCSITQPFFSAPNLESLHIRFDEYTSNSARPTVSLGDILPLETSWSRLHTMFLWYQPATITELKSLVSRHSKTVRDFVWYSPWLLEGTWPDAVEIIRGFKNLEDFRLEFPKGDPNTLTYGWPKDEVRKYILRETNEKPIR